MRREVLGGRRIFVVAPRFAKRPSSRRTPGSLSARSDFAARDLGFRRMTFKGWQKAPRRPD